MEGDGPSAGEKRHVGLILASESPYALDVAASSIIGIEPMTVPTIRAASLRNLFSGDLKDIDIKGIQLNEIKIAPSSFRNHIMPTLNRRRVRRLLKKLS